MKTKHVLDQLSAYIDGEAEHPELIARHLQQCANCARRHMELSKLSAHMKSLTPTEPHPAFLTRVMAGVAETEQASKRSWIPGWSLGAVAAAVLLAGGAAYFAVAVHRERPVDFASVKTPAAPQSVDENALMQKIEDRLALGGSTPLLDSYDASPYAEADVPLAAFADMAANIEQLASRQLDAAAFDEGGPEPALDVALGTLDESEAQAFAGLLSEYARKGQSS